MASKKQLRFIRRAENKANSGIPESDEEFEDRMAAEELKEHIQWTDKSRFNWLKVTRRQRF